jgi:hypothetical protein
MSNNKKGDLLKFIDFHSRAKSSSMNSIEAITSSSDLKSKLVEMFEFLKKDLTLVKYSKQIDPSKFVEDLVWPLYQGKTILVETDTLDFDPIVYDQLFEFRDKNRFSLSFARSVPFSPNASLFLYYKGNDKKIWEVADHVFRMEEAN